jgi:hypothetical protein
MVSKVRAAIWAGLILVAMAGILSACERRETAPPAIDVSDDYDRSRFGDPYEVLLNETPAAPDRPPVLSGDTLLALVTYPGGCKDHDFDLRYDAGRDTSRIRLHHDARGDRCEAMIIEELEMTLPQRALAPRTVVLENPLGGPPFVLRW